jgi:hypothetical protein
MACEMPDAVLFLFFKACYKTPHGLFGHIFYFTARTTPGFAHAHGKHFLSFGSL